MNSQSVQNGTIFYEKSKNRWRCKYEILDPETSKFKMKSKMFLTQKEAQDFFATLHYQKGNTLYAKNNGIPLNLLIRSLLEKKLETGLVGERTYARTMETIVVMEKCELLKKNIDEITSDELQMYLNSLKDYSKNTIKKFVDQLNQAYKFAQNKGYIIKNPMFDTITPKSNKKPREVRALEIEEQQKLTDYLQYVPIQDEPYKNVFLFQMFLGLRIGEALALQTSDINLHKNLISISKTLTTDKNKNVIMGDTTKTYAGTREIPIPESLLNSVKSQMILAENHKDKLLFVDTRNNYLAPRKANDRLKTITKKLGITGITTHSLRHTYGTRCIEAGMRAVALQRLMGHTDISVTLNTYTSIFNKYKEQELEKVNEYYLNNDILTERNLLNESEVLDHE